MNASPATNTNSQNLDLAALIEREEATHLVAYTSWRALCRAGQVGPRNPHPSR